MTSDDEYQLTGFARLRLWEGHPDAVYDPDEGIWIESDEALRKRVQESFERGKQ